MKKSRLRRSNPARKRWKFVRNYGGPAYLAAIQGYPCCACGAEPPSVFAHTVARGMGGCGGSAKDGAPLCDPCHKLYDEKPWRFAELFPWLDVKAVAAELYALHGHLIPHEEDADV